MAVYLKAVTSHPQASPHSQRLRAVFWSASERPSTTPAAGVSRRSRGRQAPHWPPLANNQSIETESAVNPIRMVLNGGYRPAPANPRPYGMPPFAGILSDNEVAAVVSYIRTAGTAARR